MTNPPARTISDFLFCGKPRRAPVVLFSLKIFLLARAAFW
jgi:hypothetical protein